MIDRTDRYLKEWVGAVANNAAVSLAVPSNASDEPGVGLYLLDLVPVPPARGVQLPPLQIALRYLVTTHAPAPEEAHRLLGTLVFAALENPEFDVDLAPLPATVWAAFGVAPRPSFLVRVPLRHERPQPPVSPVRMPLVVKQARPQSLRGVVLGPGNQPIAGAQVELSALELSTRTDTSGRFGFTVVPAPPHANRLRVRAKGQEVTVATEDALKNNASLVVHLQDIQERKP